MANNGITLANAHEHIGEEIGLTDWVDIDQMQVNIFGEITRWPTRGHNDPEWAERESPYGGTIAQGFLMLDFIIYFSDQTGLRPADSVYNLNYGFDKVRFIQPVPVGDTFRLRDRISLLDATHRDDGRCLMTTKHELEVNGIEGPVVYAEWLSLWTPAHAA